MDISKKIIFKTHYSLFTEIEKDDNRLIYKLRSSKKKNLLFNENYTINTQYKYYNDVYLKSRTKNEEIYFKIHPLNNQKNVYGFVRLTNLKKKLSFSWDSLIVSKKSPPWFAIDIAVAIYNIGFNTFNKKNCGPWIVPKEGIRVKNFHKKMGFATIIKEDKRFCYFNISKQQFRIKYNYFKKINLGIIKSINSKE
jgi:hypothetical protein